MTRVESSENGDSLVSEDDRLALSFVLGVKTLLVALKTVIFVSCAIVASSRSLLCIPWLSNERCDGAVSGVRNVCSKKKRRL